MFVADTCSLVAFFENHEGTDVELIVNALDQDALYLSPVVASELLSAAEKPAKLKNVLEELKRLAFLPGFWERAGLMRVQLRSKGYKAHLADCLIAQSCIDHEASLITRDRDFRHYATHCGLKVV